MCGYLRLPTMPHAFALPIVFTQCIGLTDFVVGAASVDRFVFVVAVERSVNRSIAGDGQHSFAWLYRHVTVALYLG